MGELLILILLIGLVFYIISKVRESPFRYPYFEYCFDVSGKRKPNIEDFIDAYINNNGIVHNSAPLFFQNICNIAKALLRSYYDNGISDLNGILASGNLDLTISVQVTYKEVFLQVQFR